MANPDSAMRRSRAMLRVKAVRARQNWSLHLPPRWEGPRSEYRRVAVPPAAWVIFSSAALGSTTPLSADPKIGRRTRGQLYRPGAAQLVSLPGFEVPTE